MELTVGQVAALAKVSVRTLHHYDEIGLLSPAGRSRAGYRLYADDDLDRLHQVILYRGLGFSLDDVATILDDRTVTPGEHLRRQLELLAQRIDELEDMRLGVERQLEARTMDIRLTREEKFEIFGEDFARFGDEYADEAEQQITRWFYDCTVEIHRGLGQMYVADQRFTATYEDLAPGLARYVSDAVVANADRREVTER